MNCPACGRTNPDGAKFCNECAGQLPLHCSNCGTSNPVGSKFCNECGGPLTSARKSYSAPPHDQARSEIHVSSEPIDSSSAIDGERKNVTALFADLKGSTELLETLDPEEGRAIVEPLLRIMSDAVRRYEGYVVRTTGDGIFALFGAPVAYEDHPQRALYAALQMQQELHVRVQAQAVKGRPALEARVGVHTGEVVAYPGEASGKVEYRLIGHTANLAARMESIAAVGSIAISEATAKLCDGYFDLLELGPTTVKGVSTPVNVYEVLGPGLLRTHFELSTRRGLTRFVGRERELEQMRRALEQSMVGHGQIVAVVAEAGTGKSRLFYEFKATLPAECKVLEAYSVSYGKASAWLPVLELLRGYFLLAEMDDPPARRAKVRAAVLGLDAMLEDTLPYLFGLLGIVDGPDPHAQMDARIKRQRTLDAIKRIILRDSLRQPVVVIFEDLHWIDEQTQALLNLLADSIASARVLLLFNYRPEYRHEWTNKSHYLQIPLAVLGSGEGTAMLTALLGEGVELNPVKRLIAERTDGNPFFIEEIVQSLLEDGSLVRNGVVRVTRSMSQLRLPATVQGMLASRIDRLESTQKELLQTLAVIGREASLRLVRKVITTEESRLNQQLAELRAAEFIYEQPAVGDTRYVFKHALTQEVAYSSLLIERRKQLHERVGYSIETLFADKLDDHVDSLCHHYSHSDNADKAIEYLIRAGEQAMRRWAHDQAIRNLNGAIERLRTLQDSPERKMRELSLQMMLISCLSAFTGYGTTEVERTLARARELCAALGDPPELFAVSYVSWSLQSVRADMRAAKDAALLLLARAEEMQDRAALGMAQGAMGMTLYFMGEPRLAAEHLRSAVSLDDLDYHLLGPMGVDPRVVHLCYLGWALFLAGYPEQAVQREI
jgi:class 3 adenylate cyclase